MHFLVISLGMSEFGKRFNPKKFPIFRKRNLQINTVKANNMRTWRKLRTAHPIKDINDESLIAFSHYYLNVTWASATTNIKSWFPLFDLQILNCKFDNVSIVGFKVIIGKI